jgi:hypothetical protein
MYGILAGQFQTLTKRNRKQLNNFERKVYRGILDPVYVNEKENWRILTDKEIYVIVNTLRTGDACLPFNTRLVFTHLITQYLEYFLIWSSGPDLKKNVT